MADADPSTLSIFSHISQAITWLLVIIGWYIVDGRQNARETRKELKAELDSLITAIECIVDSATTFHTASQQDKSASSNIKYRLRVVSNGISLLKARGVNIKSEFLVKFRQACTLNNFDTNRFRQQPPNSMLIHNIQSTGQDLIFSLQRTFISKYTD